LTPTATSCRPCSSRRPKASIAPCSGPRTRSTLLDNDSNLSVVTLLLGHDYGD
jgi:hypothetical protein